MDEFRVTNTMVVNVVKNRPVPIYTLFHCKRLQILKSFAEEKPQHVFAVKEGVEIASLQTAIVIVI